MANIYISEITRADLPFIHWVENLEEYWHINEHPGPYTLEEITDCFFPSKKYPLHKQQRWIIRKDGEDFPIGILDAFNFNEIEKSIGVGILIPNSSNHNKGYGKESIRLLMKKLTFDNQLEKVFALIDKDNLASQKLFQQCEFVFTREQMCLNRIVNRYEKLL
jgi:RimJ/RimL family protein N-acetyltransferase